MQRWLPPLHSLNPETLVGVNAVKRKLDEMKPILYKNALQEINQLAQSDNVKWRRINARRNFTYISEDHYSPKPNLKKMVNLIEAVADEHLVYTENIHMASNNRKIAIRKLLGALDIDHRQPSNLTWIATPQGSDSLVEWLALRQQDEENKLKTFAPTSGDDSVGFDSDTIIDVLAALRTCVAANKTNKEARVYRAAVIDYLASIRQTADTKYEQRLILKVVHTTIYNHIADIARAFVNVSERILSATQTFAEMLLGTKPSLDSMTKQKFEEVEEKIVFAQHVISDGIFVTELLRSNSDAPVLIVCGDGHAEFQTTCIQNYVSHATR